MAANFPAAVAKKKKKDSVKVTPKMSDVPEEVENQQERMTSQGQCRFSTPSEGVSKIMVFEPTMEQFENFPKFIEFMESKGAHKAGIAKVIPPAEYVARMTGYSDIDSWVIPSPKKQTTLQNQLGGFYQTQESLPKTTFGILRKEAEKSENKTPNHSNFKQLEDIFWNEILIGNPIYGADVLGTLTDKSVKSWNVNHLESILNVSNQKMPGIKCSFLYFGSWKTSFCYHCEDFDLYSISFLHYGYPKTWYAVPTEHGGELENLARTLFKEENRQCPAFLRHKMTLISPQTLEQYGIPYDKITQKKFEFVVTFPRGYHAGFNHGVNVAEASNFATERWIEYGKRAVECRCKGYKNRMPKIDMTPFIKKFQPTIFEKWLSGQDYGGHPEDPKNKSFAPGPESLRNKLEKEAKKIKKTVTASVLPGEEPSPKRRRTRMDAYPKPPAPFLQPLVPSTPEAPLKQQPFQQSLSIANDDPLDFDMERTPFNCSGIAKPGGTVTSRRRSTRLLSREARESTVTSTNSRKRRATSLVKEHIVTSEVHNPNNQNDSKKRAKYLVAFKDASAGSQAAEDTLPHPQQQQQNIFHEHGQAQPSLMQSYDHLATIEGAFTLDVKSPSIHNGAAQINQETNITHQQSTALHSPLRSMSKIFPPCPKLTPRPSSISISLANNILSVAPPPAPQQGGLLPVHIQQLQSQPIISSSSSTTSIPVINLLPPSYIIQQEQPNKALIQQQNIKYSEDQTTSTGAATSQAQCIALSQVVGIDSPVNLLVNNSNVIGIEMATNEHAQQQNPNLQYLIKQNSSTSRCARPNRNKPEKCICIKNLSAKVTADELIAHFRECGHIHAHYLPLKDGKRMSIAFLEFNKSRSISQALLMDGTFLGGKKIFVHNFIPTTN